MTITFFLRYQKFRFLSQCLFRNNNDFFSDHPETHRVDEDNSKRRSIIEVARLFTTQFTNKISSVVVFNEDFITDLLSFFFSMLYAKRNT